MNVVEICIYVLIIVLLILGVGKFQKDDNTEQNIPAVEMSQNTERVQWKKENQKIFGKFDK